jgi:hypothetical protein
VNLSEVDEAVKIRQPVGTQKLRQVIVGQDMDPAGIVLTFLVVMNDPEGMRFPIIGEKPFDPTILGFFDHFPA